MSFGYRNSVVVSGCGLPVKLHFTRLSKVLYKLLLSTFKSPPFSPIPAASGFRAAPRLHPENRSIFISGVSCELSKRPRKLCQLSHSLPMSILEGSKVQIPTRLSHPHWFQIAARNLSLAGGPMEFQNQTENSKPSQFVLKLTVSAYCVGPLPCHVLASMTGYAVWMAYHLLICPSLVPVGATALDITFYHLILVSFSCPHSILGKL